ncbi:MAG: zinc ribbon domain-containing protein [Acidimicrobiales bacterium]
MGGFRPNRAAVNAGPKRAIPRCRPGRAGPPARLRIHLGGSRLVAAGRFFPSSKTRSACGTPTAKLSLATRTFDCEHCGVVIDRDLNTARQPGGSGRRHLHRRREWPGTASVEEAPASVLNGCDR